MSLCDPYRELELYLEQAKDDISKVFDQWNGTFTTEHKQKDIQEEDWESDQLLLHFDAIIHSDIKELCGRSKINSEEDSSLEISSFKSEDYDEKVSTEFLIKELHGSQSTLGSSDPLRDGNQITTATQTSPSLSHSSTNLTWASDCSSSPCLASTSDADVADDDNQSSSSADCVDQDQSWIRRHKWQQELGTKSSSAPVLKRVNKVNKQARSQSDRHLVEIEATEACKWLRAAGFPQYAQMYEDMEFPIDISAAAQDHPLLEAAVLNSLFRRLQILNRCARLHQQRITHTDDSEEEPCALSDNWTYQSELRRWSRNCQNIQIPSLAQADDDQKEREAWKSHEVFKESPKSKPRRSGSTKHRRRRDGVVVCSTGTNVLDLLSKQLGEGNVRDSAHVSDSECTARQSRRRKTRSLDKSDTWSVPPDSPNRIIWDSPQKYEQIPETDVYSTEECGRVIYNLSCTQLQVLRKLALLKLTAHMEKYCPSHRTGWNWDLPKFIKKIKTPAYREKSVFEVPLTVILQRTGQCIPKNIEDALIWLTQNAYDQVGLFRKPGVKSRIQALRNLVEAQDNMNFNDQQAYDVADLVKQYFRELPEVLLTIKLSETFILIFQYIPPHLRKEAVLCALLLMPDEHSEVLHILLHFLKNIAKHSEINQMTESNLAMCFAPSLFHYSQSSSVKQSLGSPHPKELAENRAAHECLLYLLKRCDSLFIIPTDFIKQCKTNEIKETKAVQLCELGLGGKNGWRGYLNDCEAALQKEAREKGRGWIVVPSHNLKVEIAYKKVADGHPLRLWKVSAEIEAPPSVVLHTVLRERHKWDPELQQARIVSQIDKNCEIFQYVRRTIKPLPNEEYCTVRTWRTDLPKDACMIVETSVEHPDAMDIPGSVRGIILASRYLIEPCGSGRSRLLHHSRVDTRGRMPDWYHKNYGHISAIFIANIQNSFRQTAAGPESKV